MKYFSFFSKEITIHKKLYIYIIFFCLISIVSYSQNTPYNLKKITTEDGLSNNTVYSLLQDKNNFIWIGTKDGLNRYDGHNFVIYRNNTSDTTSISHNEIWGLAEDNKGNIWIATYGGGVSKFDPTTETFKNFKIKPLNSRKRNRNYINTIFVDSKDRVWAGNWTGMDLYNPEKEIFEPIVSSPNDNIFKNCVYSIAEDKQGVIWLGTDASGLISYHPITKKITYRYPSDHTQPSSLIASPITSFIIDQNNNFWLQHEELGTTYINTKTGQTERYFENYTINKNFKAHTYRNAIFQDKSGRILASFFDQGMKFFKPNTIDSTTIPETLNLDKEKINIKSIIEDHTGSLWIGTEDEGLLYIDNNVKPFQYKSITTADTKQSSINKVFEDTKGNLWLVSDDFGLKRINSTTGEVANLDELLGSLDIDLSTLVVQDITQDSREIVWLSTFKQGAISIDLNTLEKKNLILIRKNDSLTKNKDIISLNNVLTTKDSVIWFGAKNAYSLLSYDLKNKKLKHFTYNDTINNLPGLYISDLEEAENGSIFVSFSDKGLYLLDKKTQRFKTVSYNPATLFDQTSQNVTCIYKNKKRIIWIGTANGLYKKNLTNHEVVHYTTNEGLSHNYITNIIEDSQGYLWITSNKGISKFDPTSESFKNYTTNDGLIESEYIVGSADYSNKNNIIYFGGKKGYTFFDPTTIKDSKNIPSIVITDFMKKSETGSFEKVAGINAMKEITLSYNERDFFIEFTAIDFTKSTTNKHKYLLEGYHQNWTELGTRRQVTFTNLDPGTYTLKIKSANNDNNLNNSYKSLIIKILTPWWRSWWAYSIYSILALMFILGLHYYRVKNIETSKLKKLKNSRTRLFTNISHELRTPLTLISGPIEQILNQNTNSLDSSTQAKLEMVKENTNSLTTLVNDILELSKLEENTLILHKQPIYITSFLKQIADKFVPIAEKNKIEFTSSFEKLKERNVLIDRQKTEKIIINFLSNAFKNTPHNGAISFTAIEYQDQLQIIVRDTGKGISKKDLPHNSDHYFKSGDKNKGIEGGSVIGLSLIKELIDLMNGQIAVNSTLGKGSTYTVSLPIDETSKKELTYTTEFDEDISVETISLDHLMPLTDDLPKEYTILIVEDNLGMQKFINSILENRYHIVIANHGEEALAKLKTKRIDLIISDIMMPVMDGYTLLENIKTSNKYQDIPVIMLTALAEIDHKLKALIIGVDDYLSKPFIAQELLARTFNLISRYEARKEIKNEINRIHTVNNNIVNNLTDDTNIEIKKTNLQNKKDLQLIEQVSKIIKTNLENPDFKLKDLCTILNISERQLRRKITLATGLSPKKFQQEIMLQKAKSLLENNEYGNISAISLSIGMSHVTRFSKLYEARFGKHPSSYF